jgi:decaprenylphospho-beta-D-erythro-pentofuranosid-2-ulose 2-reductase
MLNSFGDIQKVLVLGGKSDLALTILSKLRLAYDAEIVLLGRDMSDTSGSLDLKQFDVKSFSVDFNDLDKAISIVSEVFLSGDVDLVIFAYAILGEEKFQLAPENFQKVLETNFMSQAILLNLVNTKLLEQKHGQILCISSVAGIRARKRNFVYGVSKFGVDFVAQGLQKNNLNSNVSITILRPGFIHSKMTTGLVPAPFATTLEKVGSIAVNALVGRKRIVYAPKKLLFVMFVLRILPERIFRIIDK